MKPGHRVPEGIVIPSTVVIVSFALLLPAVGFAAGELFVYPRNKQSQQQQEQEQEQDERALAIANRTTPSAGSPTQAFLDES
jgi:hypothetical protein